MYVYWLFIHSNKITAMNVAFIDSDTISDGRNSFVIPPK